MPRVGSSRMTTFGSRRMLLAMTTFCWLPPGELVDPHRPGPLDEKPGDAFGGEGLGARGRDPAGRRDTRIVAEREIVGDRLGQDEALRLAILRHQHDPVVQRVARPVEPKDIAADLDPAGGDRVGARDRAHEFGAARADDAGDAEHFAGPDREADVLERAFGAGQPLDLDQRRGGRRRRDFGEHPVERPADHLLDQRLDRNLRVSWVATSRPSRSTAIRSAMRAISSRRWLM